MNLKKLLPKNQITFALFVLRRKILHSTTSKLIIVVVELLQIISKNKFLRDLTYNNYIILFSNYQTRI